jgi:signal transduction histidine kinase
VALSELVAGVIAAHLPLAEARRIDLGATPTTGEPVVDGEQEALRILISNLVSNASATPRRRQGRRHGRRRR